MPARTRDWVIAVLAAALFMAACGGSDDDADDSGRSSTAADEETSTTQPAASDPAVVRPYIEDLLASWDEAMTPILGDPQAVADDPEHPLRADLAESFTEESPYIEDLSNLLEGYISQDTGLLPGPTGLVQQTTFLEFTRTPDDDHVSFVFCTFTDGVDFSLSTGEERPSTVGVRQGAGDAARVDGRWLLDQLQRLGFEEHPAGTPNPCPDLAAPDEG